MEVGRAGQGGPINIDYKVKNEVSSDAAAVKPVEEIKSAPQTQKIGQDNPTAEEVSKAVDKLNKFLEDENVHAVYEVHEKLNDVMIKIVNDETNEIVLEIPPKKILDMVAKMMETVGVLLDKKA
jgi:flagellar protein FlaG